MKNILVIDDTASVRSMVAATLVQAGYGVRQAKSGQEGIQRVIHQKPDLIICDVKMPGFDGYRTLEAIRKCSGTAAISFILMTGSMGPDDFRRGMASGADDYVTKPFTPEELLATVKSRFARQNDIQTDIFRQVENQELVEFRRLSKEIADFMKGKNSVGSKDNCSISDQELDALTIKKHQPVFCLD